MTSWHVWPDKYTSDKLSGVWGSDYAVHMKDDGFCQCPKTQSYITPTCVLSEQTVYHQRWKWQSEKERNFSYLHWGMLRGLFSNCELDCWHKTVCVTRKGKFYQIIGPLSHCVCVLEYFTPQNIEKYLHFEEYCKLCMGRLEIDRIGLWTDHIWSMPGKYASEPKICPEFRGHERDFMFFLFRFSGVGS